jgi:copper ion binding protein
MSIVTYHVPAISCGHCIHNIKTELGELDGVVSVDANLESKKVTIEFNTPVTEETLKQLLAEINYPVEA